MIAKEEDGKNRVFSFGNSDFGQCGYGGTLTQYTPIEITDHFPTQVV